MNFANLPNYAHDHGFWIVNNSEILYNKVQSLVVAKEKNTSDIRFYYYDHIFEKQDWAIEPTDTIENLYAQHAHYLRSQYDYLVVLYSGGSDSSNLLKTFLYNNIKIDEVAYWYSSYNEYDNLANAEIINAGSELLQKLINVHNITVRKLNVNSVLENLKISKDWYFTAEPNLILEQFVKPELLYHNKSWLQLCESGKKVGVILGTEKPRLYYENNAWYSAFLDVANSYNWEKYHYSLNPITLENFYISPHSPQITIKQSHMVKNFIKKTYDTQFIMDNFCNNGKFNQQLYFKIVRNSVYPYWNDNTYTIGKDVPIFKEKYRWLWSENNELTQNYLVGFDWLNCTFDKQNFNGGDARNGLRGNWSKRYCLGV